MEFYRCSLFVTFVVVTVDQFVGRVDGPLEQQRQDSLLLRGLWSAILSSRMFISLNFDP